MHCGNKSEGIIWEGEVCEIERLCERGRKRDREREKARERHVKREKGKIEKNASRN